MPKENIRRMNRMLLYGILSDSNPNQYEHIGYAIRIENRAITEGFSAYSKHKQNQS